MKLYFKDRHNNRIGIDICEKCYCDSNYFDFLEENCAGGSGISFIRLTEGNLKRLVHALVDEQYRRVDESILFE